MGITSRPVRFWLPVVFYDTAMMNFKGSMLRLSLIQYFWLAKTNCFYADLSHAFQQNKFDQSNSTVWSIIIKSGQNASVLQYFSTMHPIPVRNNYHSWSIWKQHSQQSHLPCLHYNLRWDPPNPAFPSWTLLTLQGFCRFSFEEGPLEKRWRCQRGPNWKDALYDCCGFISTMHTHQNETL